MWRLTLFQVAVCSALAFTLILLCLFGLNNLLLLFYSRIRPHKRKVAAGKSICVREWPFVTIQVATYNEKGVIARLLENCLKLDYPADKLEIVVVDDSTDETIDILREYERRYYPRIKVIHRSERKGFKAGALNEALKHSRGDFLLILDADSVPEPNFLKKIIPLFIADDELGFAQGKVRYLNAKASWLTETFALINDWFAVFIQSALSKCGMIMSFIGHGGVFRRKAVEDVGGWMSDTITEDIDMAYRVQLKGWKAIYVEDAISLEEVPPNYHAALKRFRRHFKGPIQNLIKHGKKILKHDRLSMLKKAEALIQLAYPLVYPLGLICMFLALLMYLFVPGEFLDFFWCSAIGFICSIMLFLTFPYMALIVSFIPAAFIIAILLPFTLIFILKGKSIRKNLSLKKIFGATLVWNDNLLNCLMPLIEVLAKKGDVWVPTERMSNRRETKQNGIKSERDRAAILRVISSAIVLVLFVLISCMNFSLNSLGILVPAILWLHSAYLILRS